MAQQIRILMAKPGLDGHDRGIKILARAFRDSGMEVIYLGLRQTPGMIVNAAIQEDADVIALSILSGAHMTIFKKVNELLKENHINNILITGGGIIPKDDMDILSNDDLIAKMHDFKRRGLVRVIGASTKTVEGGITSLTLMDTVMASYNPDYVGEKAVLDFAAQHDKGVLLKKVLSSGHSKDVQNAFDFCFAEPAVTSAIVGTINPDHLLSNAQAVMRSLAASPHRPAD